MTKPRKDATVDVEVLIGECYSPPNETARVYAISLDLETTQSRARTRGRATQASGCRGCWRVPENNLRLAVRNECCPAIAPVPLPYQLGANDSHDLHKQRPSVVVGLNYKTAQIKLRDANLNIRVLANRRDLPLEPGQSVTQTPQGWRAGELGTVVGVTLSGEKLGRKQFSY